MRFAGLDISIENPKGSKRSGVDPGGKPWEVEMSAHYGYIRRTEGHDGEQVDVYIASDREDNPVFVVDQVDPKTNRFDEHKVVLGAASRAEAESIYDAHFSDASGPARRKDTTRMSMDGFKEWLKQGDTKKPIARQKRAPATAATPTTPERMEARLRDPDTQRALRHMATQAGWAQRGGELLRDENDKVIGRTKWLPNEPWYAEIPERFNPAGTIEAVGKAIAGEKLAAKERRVVGYMLDNLEASRDEGRLSPEEQAVELALRQEEDEAEREAREEREAIMAEAGLALDALPYDEIDALFAQGEASLTDEGIDRFVAGETPEGGGRAEEADTGRAVAGGAARGAEARDRGDAPLLEAYTAENLAEREQAQLDAERREAEKTAAAQHKRQADRDREGFVLTGSDNVADELEARGQKSLLDQPGIPKAIPSETDAQATPAPAGVSASGEGKAPLRIEDLTEKAIIVRGNTETHKARFKALKGLWNPKQKGWVFPKKREGQVRAGLEDLLTQAQERRTDIQRRKRIGEMSREEIERELLTSALTGLHNRRAYEDAERLPIQVSIDADSLKWVNDNLGHGSGDKLLAAIGEAIGAEATEAYHLSGDEFVVQAESETAALRIMAAVNARLEAAVIAAELPDGSRITLNGLGVSYGLGSTLEEADRGLADHKGQREAAGLRAARGEQPPGAVKTAPERKPDRGGKTAAEEGVEGQAPRSAKVQITYHGRTISVTPPKRLGYKKLVFVDAAKLDAAWARDKGFYVGPGGTGAAIEGRYQEFQQYIATHDTIKASWVDVDAQGRVSFGDGRHRLAVLRDAGLKALPVGMSNASIKNAEKAGMLAGASRLQAPAATAGDGMDAAVDHALSAAAAKGWTLPRTQGTPTLLNKLGMLAYLDVDRLDDLATRRDIPHNEYFRMLHNAWSDYERNQREEPGSKYPAEDLQRQLEALERKLAALLPRLEEANPVTAEFYRTQIPALIAAARKTAGIEKAPKVPAAPPAYGAANKIFTADAAAAARERLRKKLGTVRTGLDPEMFEDGITLAGYHIEAGARKFADFAKAMIADLGEAARPYLRAWYKAVQNNHGFDFGAAPSAVAIDDTIGPREPTQAEEGNDVHPRSESSPAQPEGNSGVPPLGEGARPVDRGQRGRGERGKAGTDAEKLAPATPQDDETARGDGRGGSGDRPELQPQAGRGRVHPGGDAANGRRGAGEPGMEPVGAGGRGTGAGGGVTEASPPPPPKQPTLGNYHIADPERLIGGGPKSRFAHNRAAIEAYKAFTDEGRDPTPEERDALAGYIGWGSFGQELFKGNWERPSPKEGWEAEDKWLRERLIGGGPKSRFAHNRAAIEAYKAFTDEGRDPTPEERDALAACRT